MQKERSKYLCTPSPVLIDTNMYSNFSIRRPDFIEELKYEFYQKFAMIGFLSFMISIYFHIIFISLDRIPMRVQAA